jgi:hypothetical protein
MNAKVAATIRVVILGFAEVLTVGFLVEAVGDRDWVLLVLAAVFAAGFLRLLIDALRRYRRPSL